MSEEISKSELEQLYENMENWGFSVQARIEFNRFVDAIESNDASLLNECMKVNRIIDDIILNKEKKQFEKKLEEGRKLYRARIINPDDDTREESGIGITQEGKFVGYNAVNSRESMLGIAGEGRNNIAGSSYLYVASNAETACMEIKSQFGDLISLATFEVNEPLKIIDFASEKQFSKEDTRIHGMSMGTFFSQLMFRYCEPVRGKNAYRATQLISDYLRKTGIDGICYKSFLSPGGINYTIFNCHPDKILFKNSKILIHKQAKHSFWDFNEQCAILSNEDEKMIGYDKEIAEKHRKGLIAHFRTIDATV